MKLRREFNARQAGLGNNYHAMYASCQSRAAGLAYTIAKAIIEDKKDAELHYTNIQVWEKETDNTDPQIHFWEKQKSDREESKRCQQEECKKKREKSREKDGVRREKVEEVPREAENGGVGKERQHISNMMIAWTCPILIELPHWIGLEMMKLLSKVHGCAITMRCSRRNGKCPIYH
uniref:Uncharacterized protein n=1 Tax=Romanomermis culicivorax TaxID=13658 RepID=A0A915HGU8_ROMCU